MGQINISLGICHQPDSNPYPLDLIPCILNDLTNYLGLADNLSQAKLRLGLFIVTQLVGLMSSSRLELIIYFKNSYWALVSPNKAQRATKKKSCWAL